MTKYGLPIVTDQWADCDSGTPIFWSLSFLAERGCDLPQEGTVSSVSLYSSSSNDRRPNWDCVFQMSECLKIGSESWSKWNGGVNSSPRILELSWQCSFKFKRFSFILGGFVSVLCGHLINGRDLLYTCICCFYYYILLFLCVKTFLYRNIFLY